MQIQLTSNEFVFSSGTEHRVYLTKAIGAPSNYTDLFELLISASEHDTIHFFINTPGGRVDTTTQLCTLLENCQAELVGHLVGQAASAGSVIPMFMDSLSVSPYAYMMIHNYSGGAYGKGDDSVLQAENTRSWVQALYRSAYDGFLTTDELENIIFKNQDIYLGPEQIEERWELVLKAREEAMEEFTSEMTKAQLEEVKNMVRDEIIAEYKAGVAAKRKKKKLPNAE
jgi:ATP-dependent protease ClpP protease subunit